MPVGGTLQAATVSAFNVGDGTLTYHGRLRGAMDCADRRSASTLRPVRHALHSGRLQSECGVALAGKHTGLMTISDPNAIDAPQYVVITVVVGGACARHHRSVCRPRQRRGLHDLHHQCGDFARGNHHQRRQLAVHHADGSGLGAGATADIPTYLWKVAGNPAGLGQGTYSGTIKTVGGASHPYDTKTVPVTCTSRRSPSR